MMINPITVDQEQRALAPNQAAKPIFTYAELEGTIQARFARVVSAYPTQPALIDKVSYTYTELNAAANRVAHTLLAQLDATSKASNEPIILLVNQDASQVVAVLGVLKTGNIYIALSPTTPLQRLRNLLESSGAQRIVTTTQFVPLAAELISSSGAVLNLDEIAEGTPAFDPPLPMQPPPFATIAYTSGSTGTPKGIVQSHRVVLHRAWHKGSQNRLDHQDRVALINLANFGDVWVTLLHGSTLIFYDVAQGSGVNLAEWLIDKRITNLHIPIELYRQLLDALPSHTYFPHLRILEPSGRFYRHDVERSWPYLPADAVITSRFASTETKRVTLFTIDRTTPLTTNIIPTGYPIADVEIFLLNEAGAPAAIDEPGQIHVRSSYLPSGYWRDPALTQQVYQPDPERPGWHICCTGDWGKLRTDGMLEFIGRKDARVKIRGHRIDLGEVEAALLNITAVRSAVVTAQERPDGEKYLVAYYVPRATAGITVSELRAAMAHSLPLSMIPAVFMPLAALPLLPNGKVDRKALPAPAQNLAWARPALATAYLAARTPIEEMLVGIWEEVLGIQPVGVDDPFMELGGNSLRAMQIQARLSQQLQSELPTQRLFACATIAAMALLLVQQQAAQLDAVAIEQFLSSVELL